MDAKGRQPGHRRLTEVLCQCEEDKKLTIAEEGRAAPSNSEMIVSLSGSVFNLVMVLVMLRGLGLKPMMVMADG